MCNVCKFNFIFETKKYITETWNKFTVIFLCEMSGSIIFILYT